MTNYSIMKTELGDLTLVANESELIGIYFEKHRHMPKMQKAWTLNPRLPVLLQAAKQLKEYFAGKRDTFSIPMKFAGTDFQKKIWKEIAQIPFGKTKSYGDVAKAIGKPRAVRAVGGACGANSIPILVPCHRVLAANNQIGGFGSGLGWKCKLLELEGVDLGVKPQHRSLGKHAVHSGRR